MKTVRKSAQTLKRGNCELQHETRCAPTRQHTPFLGIHCTCFRNCIVFLLAAVSNKATAPRVLLLVFYQSSFKSDCVALRIRAKSWDVVVCMIAASLVALPNPGFATPPREHRHPPSVITGPTCSVAEQLYLHIFRNWAGGWVPGRKKSR